MSGQAKGSPGEENKMFKEPQVRFFQFSFKISTNDDSKPPKTRLKIHFIFGCVLGVSKPTFSPAY